MGESWAPDPCCNGKTEVGSSFNKNILLKSCKSWLDPPLLFIFRRLLEVFISSLLLSIILGGAAARVSGGEIKLGKELGEKLKREINPEDELRQEEEDKDEGGEGGDDDAEDDADEYGEEDEDGNEEEDEEEEEDDQEEEEEEGDDGDEEESEDVNGMVHLIHNQVLFEPV